MTQFVEDRALRDAMGHAEVIRQAQALLADRDPAVRRAARGHLASSSSDEVRKLVGLPPKKSPAGSAGGMHGSRGPTGERRQPQKSAAALPASGGKAARSAIKKVRLDFSHLAAACDAGEVEIEATAQVKQSQTFDDIPAGHGMRAAAIRNAIVANAGRIPGVKSPEDLAAFVAACATKCRAPSR